MKITFWSPIHGQAGTTSNILATALITGIQHKKKCLLTHMHFNFNNLEAPLVAINAKENREFFMDVGIDALIRNFKASRLDKETLDNCCMDLPGTNISLLPGTLKANRDDFNNEMESVMLNLLRTVENFRDIVFIDVNSGDNPLSLKIIADSDLTVVNLSQNTHIIETYFNTYRNIIEGKIFYLFGNYDCNSKYNISNMRRKYHGEITSSNSGVIPYNTLYMDAQLDGKVKDFFLHNTNKAHNETLSYFFVKSKSATEKILKLAGIRI